MRDRPLLVVVAHLGEDVIDGFLDELKNSDAALWSSSSEKSADENVRDAFFDLISRFAPAEGTPIPGRHTPAAGLPPSESVDTKTGRRTACLCGRHTTRLRMSVSAEQDLLACPDPGSSRRAPRLSGAFFLPHQSEPKELP